MPGLTRLAVVQEDKKRGNEGSSTQEHIAREGGTFHNFIYFTIFFDVVQKIDTPFYNLLPLVFQLLFT